MMKIYLSYIVFNCAIPGFRCMILSIPTVSLHLNYRELTTAVTSKNGSQSLRFYWDLDDPSLKYYIYMHFSEVEQLQSNQSREFTIRLNSDLWLDTPVIPTHFNSITIRSLYIQ